MPNGTYGGVRGKETKIGRKNPSFPYLLDCDDIAVGLGCDVVQTADSWWVMCVESDCQVRMGCTDTLFFDFWPLWLFFCGFFNFLQK